MKKDKPKYNQLEILQLIMNNTKEIIWAIDHDYCLLFANKTYQDALIASGSEEMSVGEKVLSDDYPEDFLDFWRSNYEKCFKNESFEVISTLSFSDGLHYIENSLSPLKDEKGLNCGAIVISRDITETKRIELDLQAVNQKLELLFDLLPIGITVLNQKGEIIKLNKFIRKVLDLSPEDLLAGSYKKRRYIHTDGSEMKAEEFPSARIRNGETDIYNTEIGIIKENGELLWTDVTAVACSFPHWRVVIVTNNITERKKLEQERESQRVKAGENEKLLLKIAENYPNSYVSVIEKDGTVGFSGGQEFKRQNLNPDNFKGLTLEQVFGEETPFVKEKYLKTFNGEETSFELFINDQYQLYKTVPLYDENNEISRILSVVENITGRKTAEQELMEAKVRAEESDRLKSAFLANMSHEIRTPMNGIIGFAEVLKDPELTGEMQQEYIRIIEKSGERMLNIINDIIDISKIESGLMKLSITESDINEQLEYIYTFFKPELQAKGIRFSMRKSLPAKESIIYTDREKLYAILTNLVKNAIKFTTKGHIEVGYVLKPDTSAAELEFFVKDTGIGIPLMSRKTIFERFIQADLTDGMVRQGAGLGLSISKAYLEMLGGKIWVESEVGNGSVFYFTLPYNSIPEATFSNEIFISSKDIETRVKKLKILVSEDDKTSEMLITLKVQQFASEIIKARTGIEAVEACRKNPDLDLVFMDIRLPEMSGYEATREIRKFNKEVIIIAQTAFALSGDKERALEAGCNDYLPKPFQQKKFNELMLKYFRKSTQLT